MRGTERERERGTEREGKREREKEKSEQVRKNGGLIITTGEV